MVAVMIAFLISIVALLSAVKRAVGVVTGCDSVSGGVIIDNVLHTCFSVLVQIKHTFTVNPIQAETALHVVLTGRC